MEAGRPGAHVISKNDAMAEFRFREDGAGLWIDVDVDRRPYSTLGPYSSVGERQAALDDLVTMLISSGAQDMPTRTQ